MTAVDLAAETDLPEEEARLITAQIRDSIRIAWQLISRAYEGRVWLALGYDSWDAYLANEFGAAPLRVPREERQEIVASLRDAGMTQRAIASATGISKGTVQNDLEASPAQNCPPGDDPPKVTGLDGKQYPRSKTAPPASPASQELGRQVEAAVKDELAAHRARIAEAERQRREAEEFNASIPPEVLKRHEAERPWSEAAIRVTYAIERLPLDLDPTDLARCVPQRSAYRLDDLAIPLDWLTRLVSARQEITS